jgi:uncharacterized MAPEG superfamily protein
MSSSPKPSPYPGPGKQLAIYLGFGSALCVASSLFGLRSLGSPPSIAELALPCLAAALFVLWYTLVDLQAVGKAKLASGFQGAPFETNPKDLPVAYIYALRAQLNQVEQFPFFVTVLATSSFLVNGYLCGLLGLFWVYCRMNYAVTYRRNASSTDKGLGRWTIPAYVTLGTLAGATCVQCARLYIGV